jgi:hypothetical protein
MLSYSGSITSEIKNINSVANCLNYRLTFIKKCLTCIIVNP